MKRTQTLAGCLLFSVVGLGCAWHLEREANAVRREADQLRHALWDGQVRSSERYRTAREHHDALVRDFERGTVWRQAVLDPHLHLRVDLATRDLILVNDGFVLRTISLPEETVPPPQAQSSGLIRGAYVVSNKRQGEAVRGSDWWADSAATNGLETASLMGARYLEMSDGTVVVGGAAALTAPVAVSEAILLPEVDIAAIYGAVHPGMQVYVY